MKPHPRRDGGFTLLELSIVLVIVGLLLGGLLIPLSLQQDFLKIRETEKRLEVLKNALLGYAAINRKLPCPGNASGGGLGNCATAEGTVPWKDLGLGQADARDAWNNWLRYRVDAAYNNSTATLADPPDTSSALRIRDLANNDLTNTSANSPVVAVIFSCGKNGRPDAGNDGNGTANSDASCSNPDAPNDAIYIQNPYVENQFDDLLVFLPKTLVINRLVSAGRWP